MMARTSSRSFTIGTAPCLLAAREEPPTRPTGQDHHQGCEIESTTPDGEESAEAWRDCAEYGAVHASTDGSEADTATC